MRGIKPLLLNALLACLLLSHAAAFARETASDIAAPVVRHAPELNLADDYTLESAVHLVDGIDPLVSDGIIRAVVEIPSGTTQKWEVEKSSGNLIWEFKKGKPRRVKYIGYPGNYGMVPRTLLSADSGGDGDPLDILVLGPSVPRGSVVDARVIGMLRMIDKGEQDDKLIAVMTGGIFDEVDTISELDKSYPGVTGIIEAWFSHYKGHKKIETEGYVGRKKAYAVLLQALEDYKTATGSAAGANEP